MKSLSEIKYVDGGGQLQTVESVSEYVNTSQQIDGVFTDNNTADLWSLLLAVRNNKTGVVTISSSTPVATNIWSLLGVPLKRSSSESSYIFFKMMAVDEITSVPHQNTARVWVTYQSGDVYEGLLYSTQTATAHWTGWIKMAGESLYKGVYRHDVHLSATNGSPFDIYVTTCNTTPMPVTNLSEFCQMFDSTDYIPATGGGQFGGVYYSFFVVQAIQPTQMTSSAIKCFQVNIDSSTSGNYYPVDVRFTTINWTYNSTSWTVTDKMTMLTTL